MAEGSNDMAMGYLMGSQDSGGNNGGGMGGGFGNSFGGDWGWIILLLLIAGGGWGGFGGFGGGAGSLAADGAMLYPWMNQANLTSNGFQNQMLTDNVTSIRDGIANLSTQLCGCCGDMQMALANGFAGVEQGANARQIANMQQAFAAQTAVTQGMNDIGMSLQNCCCENRANIADLKYVVATENCADRQAVSDGVRDIIASQTASTQAILDKLCQQEIDALKTQNVSLQNQLNMANFNASQTAQNAFIAQGLNREVDALYNRLKDCPVSTVPVYGSQPIFTCPVNVANGNGCSCNGFN